MPGYSTEDFLVSWAELEADCGIPRRVHSDRGSQLVCASESVEAPDYNWDVISRNSKGQTEWRFCPSGAQWRNGAVESLVKQFKKSLELYKQTGLTYAELQSLFKKTSAVMNSRPVSARYGPRQADSDPDYLEIITPNMMLTARSGVDLPMREYSDEYKPSKRLAYKEELERTWWEQWKVQCFDSLLPTKTWHTGKRGVRVGDIVLISYSDKSKTGTYRLGMVDKVELDSDGLVRTCEVAYRLVRCDLPVEELRLYLKGLKYKRIRVPIQRLCVILPVEEQEGPSFLRRSVEETMRSDMNREDVDGVHSDKDKVEEHIDDDTISDLSDEVAARTCLVQAYRASKVKRIRQQRTNRSVKMLHRKFSYFVKLGWC